MEYTAQEYVRQAKHALTELSGTGAFAKDEDLTRKISTLEEKLHTAIMLIETGQEAAEAYVAHLKSAHRDEAEVSNIVAPALLERSLISIMRTSSYAQAQCAIEDVFGRLNGFEELVYEPQALAALSAAQKTFGEILEQIPKGPDRPMGHGRG